MIAALPRVFAFTDDRLVAERDLAARAAAMATAAGPALGVVVRSRALEGRALLSLARELSDALRPAGAWLGVSERADVARAAGAQMVLAGRGALAESDLRRVAPQALVGRSVHDAEECASAARDGADFLVAGAIYPTPTHADRPPAGLGLVRDAAKTGRPVVAIGGLTPERAGEAAAAGAWGVAAIRALWDAPEPGAAAAAFLAALPAPAPTLAVTVNGEPRRARPGISLAELLGDLGLDARSVVVEHNRRIVRRDALASTPLGEGDALELVHFVGGG